MILEVSASSALSELECVDSLCDVLALQARVGPGRRAFTFLQDGETEAGRRTFGDLDRRARAIAAALGRLCAPGDRALLLFAPGLDFIDAFFACLYAGVVAVPAYPPRPHRDQPRLRAIAGDCAPALVLTTRDLLPGLERALSQVPELAGVPLAATDELAESETAGAEAGRAAVAPDAPAFLQYTSGSTAAPKGVVVTHANLLHNQRMLRAAFGHDEPPVVVGWLPLYHDMGLVGNLLQPLYCGGHCVLMSPAAFLQRPRRWLEAISRYRATTSGGPNFAYDVCVRKIDSAERAGLDLSSWRVAFNGAEPVRAETLESFAAAFAPCGFRAEAFYPCYGLAEATLFVTGGTPGAAPRLQTMEAAALERHRATPVAPGSPGARVLVGCGGSWLGQRLVIADPETGRELGAGEVGEIRIAGPSVARGYWGRPEETRRAFVPGDRPEERFLRTGDLGFLSGGELFVAGRLKDLVILRGRNHYPQDLELTAERSHPALRPGCGAAFSVDVEGEERLVLVHEIERHSGAAADDVADAVRRAVAEEHEVQAHEVVLIRMGTVPKTSSGKIQRHACRALYLSGGLTVVGQSALRPDAGDEPAAVPDTGTAEGFLRTAFARLVGLDPARVEPDRPLTALGLDSLAAIGLQEAAARGLGLDLPLHELLAGASIAELARRAAARAPREAGEVIASVEAAASGEWPLSQGQRALWYLHRLAPDSAAYNIAGAARLSGPVDPAALRGAFQTLVDRHPALRATFAETADLVVQSIPAQAAAAFACMDVSALDAGEVRRRLHAEAFRPFDLERGPLFRAALLQGAPGGDLLVVAVHHIAADFWSMAILVRELGVVLSSGAAALPPVAASYADHVAAQERDLAARGERLWEHWQERLAGAPLLDLPTDRPRPPHQTFRGGARTARLGREAAGNLQALASRGGATLFAVLLAGFEALLARISGQDDFLVGSPASGRGAGRWEGVVGYFVDPVALRAGLAGDPTAAELLEGARAATLDALEHRGFPLARLAERLQPERDPSRPPLVQVMLALQRSPLPGLEPLAAFALGEPGARLALGGLTLESMALETPAAPLDLTLMAAELDGDLALSLQYNADLFDAATADRLVRHMANLLAALAAGPRQRLSGLALLDEAERRQAVIDWNQVGWNQIGRDRTPAPVPAGSGLWELFAAQAERTPDAVALIHGETRETYRELSARAAALARFLRRAGVGPEVTVGVLAERTPGLVAALLGVLASGGAYVPLDPAYPRERLALLLADSGASLVLVEDRLAAALPASAARAVSLERALADGEGSAEEPFLAPGGPHPEQLAYLIYTSGSTGTPKGVAIRHGSAVARVAWALAAYPAKRLARVLFSTSVCFDLSVFELFVPLAAGGAVVLADDALALSALPAAGEVTLINTVPSAMAELVRAGAVPPSVRAVNLAGEPLQRELASALYALPGIAEVHNLYGPSEDTTYSTGVLVPRGGGAPSIGLPLPDSRAYVLDGGQEPLPAGVPGELWLAGAGVARGYFGRPGLTADRFRPDPFAAAWGEPGARAYRTGDRARRRPDGEIEFIGRFDHQVKVRGFRVEPGEVEAALASHPGVAEATVAAQEDAAGVRLVAWVVAADGAEVDPAALRAFLRERLPEPLVPTAWVGLAALPRTPNGKLDRRALPAPAAPAATGAAAPRTPVEEVIAALWCDLLQVEAVGLHDRFFDLGGHSLLATRAVSRIRQALGVDLGLRALLEAPTVAALAALVEAARRDGSTAAPPLLPGPAGDTRGDLPVSFAQRRLWLAHRLAPESPAYNMPLALRLEGEAAPAALAAALTGLAARHETLRTTFAEVRGEPVQRVAPAVPVPLPVADLAGLPAALAAAESGRLLAEAARLPFDLGRGPLLRALLIRRGGEDVFGLVLHHIVSDGWSMEVLLGELAALERAARTGGAAGLPELPLQYADFAIWQRVWLAGAELERLLAAWRGRLAGAPAALELPADRPRPPVQSFRGAWRESVLEPELAAGLAALCRREGATPFMGLLSVAAVLLSRHSGQDDVVLGVPIANRDRTEIEGLIGCFANTLALRTRVAGEEDWRALLAQVRQMTLEAYADQDLPFEKLVEELGIERSSDRAPVFQAMLSFVQPPAVPGLSGLRAERIAVSTGATKLDLLLRVEARGGAFAVQAEYSTDLFDAATIDRLLAHCRTLLAGMLADPGRRLAGAALLTAAEEHQLAAEWNDTRSGAERPAACLHELFAEQARRTPEAEAVVCGDERLTFRQLDERSNRLARLLRQRGVGAESRVALFLPRSAGAIVGLLAALKAGAAYVPLDLQMPKKRLGYVLGQGRVALVLTLAELRSSLPGGRFATLCLDLEADAIAAQPAAAPEPAAGPGDLAYILYTSGSTGLPKGVMIEHRSVVSLLAALRSTVYRGAGGPLKVAVNAPLIFDASVKQWIQLLDGHALHVLPEDLRLDPARLLELLRREGVDVLDCTPGQLGALLAAGLLREGGPRLRRVLVGGEEILRPLWRELAASSVTRFWNVYGPTECTVDTAVAAVDAFPGRPTLGRPLQDVRVYVVDPWLRPVPLGAAGELAIGGAGLARGYLDRPDQTAERFVPDPWAASPGDRLYRSGDLVRLLPDGTLEFLGRVDRQVKVRGFRIELGEIEAVLAEHPAVAAAAVLLREDTPGNPRLVAYAACAPGAALPGVEELRETLRKKLPDYMTPAAFVFLPDLPRTVNGKTDRAALPAPLAAPEEGPGEEMPPLEEVLAGMMAEVLGVERVGRSDSFFELGGHSLRALELISLVQDTFEVEIPLFHLFDTPTVSGLAAFLRDDPERCERIEATAAALLRVTAGGSGTGTGPVGSGA